MNLIQTRVGFQTKNKLTNVELKNKEILTDKKNKLFVCFVCNFMETRLILGRCSCWLCTECLYTSIDSHLKSTKSTILKCPSCAEKLSTSDIRYLFTDSEITEILEKRPEKAESQESQENFETKLIQKQRKKIENPFDFDAEDDSKINISKGNLNIILIISLWKNPERLCKLWL